MMNLWTFVLLGLMAQASNGCIQTDYETIGRKFTTALTDIINKFAGMPLPDFATSCGVTATNVTVVDSNTTSTSAVFNSQNLTISFEGYITISSDCFSNAVFKFHSSQQLILWTQNAHYMWSRVSGSFSVSAESVKYQCDQQRKPAATGEGMIQAQPPIVKMADTSSVTYHGCLGSATGTEVERAYKEKCEILVKGLCEGAIHSVITIINQQYAEFTRNFTYAGYNCRYQLDDFKCLPASVISYMFLFCDGIGIVNQTKPLTLKAMTPGMIAVVYLKPKVICPFIIVADKRSQIKLTAAEKSEILPNNMGDGNLEMYFMQQAYPTCAINSTGATAMVFLRGSIRNESRNEIIAVDVTTMANVLVGITNDILQISISSSDSAQVTVAYVDQKFSSTDYDLENLRLLTSKQIPQVINTISCNIAPFRTPNPFMVQPINAQCAYENEQCSCVPAANGGP